MLKKIAALAVTLCAMGAAHASGPLDGIYFNPASSSYASVHTNGGAMLVIGLSFLPVNGIQITSALGVVRPSQIGSWDLASGSTDGTNATVSGTTLYGACNVTFAITASGGSALVRVVGASQTVVGQQSGINCGALLSTPAVTLLKAF